MKKARPSEVELSAPDTVTDDLLPEYRFDYSKARPNRFARREAVPRAVTLDADVAAVFTTAESVNTVLRALIRAMPPTSAPQSVTEAEQRAA